MSATSPLEAEIRRLIKIAGPMPVAQYMAMCLADPQHGYYVTRDPLGSGGDFITAPEISQMFGELIGLWIASVWHQMSAPANVRIIELGPGRGTMMVDAMRAAQVVPEFHAAVEIHLVEISPVLEAQQRQAMASVDARTSWHASLDEIPDGPSIIVANEFFDALPVHQAVKQEDGWHERMVGIGADGQFEFTLAPAPIPHFEGTLPPHIRGEGEGALFEWRSNRVALEIGRRVGRGNGAALVIDYGHAESGIGDTLQAVGQHSFANPLIAPGTADLTAHVDFQALGVAASGMGANIYGPVEQSEFLDRMGIRTRATALKAAAGRKALDIDSALSRLIGQGRTAMGELFKAMAIADPRIGTPPGFT